jgi:hypothetical protein
MHGSNENSQYVLRIFVNDKLNQDAVREFEHDRILPPSCWIDTHAEIVLGVVSTPTSYMAPPQLKVRDIAVERHSPGALKRQTDAGCQF